MSRSYSFYGVTLRGVITPLMANEGKEKCAKKVVYTCLGDKTLTVSKSAEQSDN